MSAVSQLAPRLAGRAALWFALRTRRQPGRRRFGMVADRFVVADGGEVVVHRLGANTGPRVLLIHGWNGSAGDWHATAEGLVAAGFSVVALDLPAHGASAGRTSSLARFVRAVREADRRHGPFDVWMAHSMGAAAALTALAEGARARRLVVVSGIADPAHTLRTVAGAFGLRAAATDVFLKAIQRQEKMAFDAVDGLRNGARIALPALIVHDRTDRVVPFAHGELLAAAMPRATLLSTRGLGHRRILDDAAVVRALVSFAKASG